MRADERQAAVAYTYAWWMTGDDDHAAQALRAALQAPDPPERGDTDVLIALATEVRAHLGDLRPLSAGSELALLHDGLALPLGTAAELAGVSDETAGTELGLGRLESLLETVREDFDHPERLGGLATNDPAAIEHARQCPSCARAQTLVERGRRELREVVAVSAPAGLLGRLVAEAALATAPTAPPEVEPDRDEAADLELVEEIDEPEVLTVDETAVEEPELDVIDEPELDVIDEPELDVIDEPELEVIDEPHVDVIDEPDVDVIDEPHVDVIDEPHVDVIDEPDVDVIEEPEVARPPVAPTRQRAAGILAGAGVVTLCVLVAVLVASSIEVPLPDIVPDDPEVTEDIDVGGPEPQVEPTASPFGPPGEDRQGFAVTQAGILRSGEDDPAPSGSVIGSGDPIRVAVDYEDAGRGVTLRAVWRVDDETYQQLRAVVSSIGSRHVWGLPVPPDGWPPGDHRIVITADDSVVAAIDFSVRGSA